MVTRKRAREEADAENEKQQPPNKAPALASVSSERPTTSSSSSLPQSNQPKERSLLDKLRNMWEFANLYQYICIFGKAVKIDEDFDMEEYETACLTPGSGKLAEIGLALLKMVSSHRGLTLELFDEYTRRQYVAKAPLRNPFGTEEVPKKFSDFDIFTKLRILHQLSLWTLWNPDRIREKLMGTLDGNETEWRIEPTGYDRHDRTYFCLDDNRLYRRSDPPPPAPKPKANSVKARRASKRRRISRAESSEVPEEDGEQQPEINPEDEDTFGGMKWECVAITLDDYQEFLASISKSKDPNERNLYKNVVENALPVIEKAAEAQRRKAAKKEKELLDLQKLATAKRSSRLADKQEKVKQERQAAEAERKYKEELAQAYRDQTHKEKMEQERQSRMMTREQRIKDREQRRLLQEREMHLIAEREKEIENGDSRISQRYLQNQKSKMRKTLEELEEETEWTFDCSGCGAYGKNADDGSHSIACDKCNVWQHSKCLGISPNEAEKVDFYFVCNDCKGKEEEEKIRKIKRINFRVNRSSSPMDANAANGQSPSKKRKSQEDLEQPSTKRSKYAEIPRFSHVSPSSRPAMLNGTTAERNTLDSPPPQNTNNIIMNGPRLSPQGYRLSSSEASHRQNSAPMHSPIKPPSPVYSSQNKSYMAKGAGQRVFGPQTGSANATTHGRPFSPPSFLPNTQANGYGPQQSSHKSPQIYSAAPYNAQPNLTPRPPSANYQNGYTSSAIPSTQASAASAKTLPSPVGDNKPSMSPSQGLPSPLAAMSPTKQSPPLAPTSISQMSPHSSFGNSFESNGVPAGNDVAKTPVVPPTTKLEASPRTQAIASGKSIARTPSPSKTRSRPSVEAQKTGIPSVGGSGSPQFH